MTDRDCGSDLQNNSLFEAKLCTDFGEALAGLRQE